MQLNDLFESYIPITNIAEGIHDRHIFKAVVVMGPPGSGKNTLVNKFLSQYGFKQEDIDDVLHRYKKINRQADYKKTHPLVSRQRSLWTQSHLPIIFNTTGRRYDRMVELKDELEEHGYDVMCVFAYVTEDTAWQRINHRAQTSTNPADKGREVEHDYFVEAYREIKRSVPQYKALFKNNFVFYVNDQTLSGTDTQVYQSAKATRAINQFVMNPVQNPIGQWMIKELQKKPV